MKAFLFQGNHKYLILFAIITLFSTQLFAQSSLIKGNIKDKSTGEGLVGVSIVVKGKSGSEGKLKATATDINGDFAIEASPDDILVVSYIGFKSKEVKASEVGSLDLEQETDTLDEVVVVGYGSADKRDVSTSLAKISSKDFNKGLITGADGLIAGKVAGLQVVPSGDPGGGSTIRLRGVSLNGQDPLYVIDGVILDVAGGGSIGGRNPLNFINPNDIESFTVLKDASATAIYGVRGANGVIVITTKAGKVGKPSISYDGNVSLGFLTRRPDVLDGNEFRSIVAKKAPQDFPKLGNTNTDWISEVTRISKSTQHNLNFSGGYKKTTYYASINYQNVQGILTGTSNDRWNFSLKGSQKLFKDNLVINIGSRFSLTKDQYQPAGIIGQAVSFDPTQSVKNPDGSYFQWSNPLATANPVALRDNTSAYGNTQRVLSNYGIEYKLPFLKGLTLYANGSLDYTKGTYEASTNVNTSVSDKNTLGTYNHEYEFRKNSQFEYYATYKKTISDHSFDVTGGYGWYNFMSNPVKISGNGVGIYNSSVGIDGQQNSRLISFFGRANYNYKGILFLGASIRRDGSSKFSETHRWGMFPSFTAGLRVLDLGFMKNLKSVMSELKIRGSWGITGNDQIGNYQYFTNYYPGNNTAAYQFGNDYVSTLRPKGVDPNIKWEQTKTQNIGIDLGFFNGRLTGSVDVYNKDVVDLLYTIAVPAGSNLSDKITTNIGQVRNRGIEFVLNSVVIDKTPFDKTGFKWSLSYNLAYNQNKIVKLDNRNSEALKDFIGYRTVGISGDVGQTIAIQKVGEPINAFFTYQNRRDGVQNLGSQSNLDLYVDQNGDGIINEKDLRVNHKPNPDFITGLTSNMSFRNFDLAFTFKGQFGNDIYNNVASSSGYYANLNQFGLSNLHASVLETNYKFKQLFSDYYVQNGSFIKLNNITLGYTFTNLKSSNIRVFATAQNLLVITPYKGVDPEIATGVDNNIYPRSIIATLGLNVTLK